jgi:hypothetical protein
MGKITLVRSELQSSDHAWEIAVGTLQTVIDGLNQDDKRGWARLFNWLRKKEPGEICELTITFPRHGKHHRLVMAMLNAVFDSQERFDDFEQFRYWCAIGAGWVTWAAGPKGGVVPIPKSISFAKADEQEFSQYHAKVVEFLRGPYAGPSLFPHAPPAALQAYRDLVDEFER